MGFMFSLREPAELSLRGHATLPDQSYKAYIYKQPKSIKGKFGERITGIGSSGLPFR
jgi:hypothetical protein